MSNLKDKAVLITGGGSGIGLAAARLFLEQGTRVAITGRNADKLHRAAESLPRMLHAHQCEKRRLGGSKQGAQHQQQDHR